MFSNPFVFYGRIRRTEYALSLLVFAIILVFIAVQASDDEHDVYWLAFLPLFWFRFAQGAKRCHDLGNSGWWQIVPFYNLWMLFADSNVGPNQYGDNPKAINYPNYPGTASYQKDHGSGDPQRF